MKYLLITTLLLFTVLSSASCARYTTGGKRYSINAVPFFTKQATEYLNEDAKREQ